jgi:hypothetical protein
LALMGLDLAASHLGWLAILQTARAHGPRACVVESRIASRGRESRLTEI